MAEPLSGKKRFPFGRFHDRITEEKLTWERNSPIFSESSCDEGGAHFGQKRAPGIYLLTDTGNNVEIILTWTDGQETRLSRHSPAGALVEFVGFDFADYRSQVEELWEEHCVFKERDEVPYADYEDFAAQAVPLSEQLRMAAPAAYWDVRRHIALAEEMTDDGEPIFASRKAFAVLTALRRPYFLQNRIRNIFEIAFADFERGTQKDRFRALEDTWPGIIDRSFSIRFPPAEDGAAPVGQTREYALSDLYELCLAELSLYFQQSKQRIARCENCWRYFIPRTEAESRYCYDAADGRPCKEIGPRNMRRFRADTDRALAAYERLRRRLEERASRLELAPPGAEGRLIPFDRDQYAVWLDLARGAKRDYQAGLISAGEFLRRIDLHGELEPYEAERTELPPLDETPWRDLIKRDMDFVPRGRFADIALLDLREPEPAGETVTAKSQILHARGGHTSLHDRYRADAPEDLEASARKLEELASGERDAETELLARVLRAAAEISLTGEAEVEEES